MNRALCGKFLAAERNAASAQKWYGTPFREAVSVVLKGLPGSLQSVRQFRSPSDLQQSLSATSQIRTAQNVPSAITDNRSEERRVGKVSRSQTALSPDK